MGIAGLWNLLEPVREDVPLSECEGKRIAVDLSGWIIQCALVSTRSTSLSKYGSPPKAYLAKRGLFFRALNLSKLGIILVFVIDGPHAPARKGKYNREAFFQECQQYKNLLITMGYLVLEAEGEAEKFCAELNMQKRVDGVLTSDGDAMVYGAQVIYKGMFTDKKEQRASKYTMTKVQSVLHMNQRDLVAFALLSKGDISDGVHSIGGKKFLELLKEFENNGVTDSLNRLKSWASSEDLCFMEEQNKRLLEMHKNTHCTQCEHEGTKTQHSKAGCFTCHKHIGCLMVPLSDSEADVKRHPLCMCSYCPVQRAVKLQTHELKIRRLALEQDKSFPRDDIINEFLSPCNTLPELSQICMKVTNYHDVYNVVHEMLYFSPAEVAKYLISWTIKMALSGILPGVEVKPVRIIKLCTEQFKKCYKVKWEKLDIDDLSEEMNDFYEINVSTSLFAEKYPEMSRQFELANSPQKGKRKNASDPTQRKMSDMFKVIKKSTGTTDSITKPDAAAVAISVNPP